MGSRLGAVMQLSGFIVILTLFAAAVLIGQERSKGHIGSPIDWSTKHVIYPVGDSAQVIPAITDDPRSWVSYLRRNTVAQARQEPAALLQPRRLKRDWAISLGPTGGMAVGEAAAKYSFNINGTYSCANDFVVYTIQAAPSATQANVVAFNNLYTGTASSSCPFGPQTPPTTDFTQPTFMWSYRVGSARVYLSPILSLDGTKVGFVNGANPAIFYVLKWVSGQGTDATHPVAPGTGGSSVSSVSFTNISSAGCTATASQDSNSSAYVDYAHDVVYVGADNGKLYRITGVFNGTPTLQYCITVNAGKHLTSPVYNQSTNQVFVSDGASLYSFTPGATGFTASGSIAIASATATSNIVLSPIVDSTNGFVYVFAGADPTNTNSLVAQTNLALTTKHTANIGPDASQVVLDGDFDNAYFTTGPKAGGGTLYACGTQSSGNKPSLFALSFSAPTGALNSTPAMSDNRNINGSSGNPNGTCSPLLAFASGGTDRLFVGAGNYTGTGGANVVTEWNINTRITSNSAMPNAMATNEWGGTSGFIVDNVATAPQTANIYFGTVFAAGGSTPCGTGNYCAVKLTQSGLK